MNGRVIVLRADAACLPLPDGSVDAVVTDPPYALTDLPVTLVAEALAAWVSGDRAYVPGTGAGFMGRSWDRFVPPPAAWDECLRVLKPGGHVLACFSVVLADKDPQALALTRVRLAKPLQPVLFGDFDEEAS